MFGYTIVSLNTVQMQQHVDDPRIRSHCYTAVEMMQPPSDTVPTLSRCCCFCMLVSLNSSVDSGWFGKKIAPKKLNTTGTKYGVIVSGGRQRHKASTRESLSGANVLQRQAAK